MIDGVVVKPLQVHADDRGYLMEVLREDDPLFERFGQAYVTCAYPGRVKAWHAHQRQTDHLCCVAGTVKLGLYDDREDSPTRGETAAVVMGLVQPGLVRIPPGVWHGFVALGGEPAVVLNLPNLPYDYQAPDERRRDPFDPTIPFTWLTRGG